MNRTHVLTLAALSIALGACRQAEAPSDAAANAQSAPALPATPALPAPVNGWIEHSLPEGVIKLQAAQWRDDAIKIPVPANGELEYTIRMKGGDAVVYSVDYGKLEQASVMLSEFHGHTEQRADGVGDLMFYSKSDGVTQHGQFVAPWDGVHGWYLKNNSARDAVVVVKLAGFYEPMKQ